MPVLGAAKLAYLSGGKGEIGTESNPIQSDADMLEWKDAQSGGRIGGPVWIKESSINSLIPFKKSFILISLFLSSGKHKSAISIYKDSADTTLNFITSGRTNELERP